jgi:hypothetical protein
MAGNWRASSQAGLPDLSKYSGRGNYEARPERPFVLTRRVSGFARAHRLHGRLDSVSFKPVSPYTIDGRVFDLPVMPPAPLSARSYHEISRFASALFAAYDEINFGDLNWGFWHARCATPHIAPVHFGAIIEALRKACADPA